MSTTLDLALVPMALELINELGTTATFNTGGTYAMNTTTGIGGWTGTASTERKVSPPCPVDSALINGDSISESDSIIYMAASGITFTPEKQRSLSLQGQNWRITEILKFYSGDDLAAYGLVIRS